MWRGRSKRKANCKKKGQGSYGGKAAAREKQNGEETKGNLAI